MSIFEAKVQYDDYIGTVAADRADQISMRDYLIAEGLASKDEHLIGYRISFGGNNGQEIEPSVLVYLSKGTFDEPSDVVRAVEISMTGPKFFSFFKRFDMVMTQKDLSLEGVRVEGPDYE